MLAKIGTGESCFLRDSGFFLCNGVILSDFYGKILNETRKEVLYEKVSNYW